MKRIALLVALISASATSAAFATDWQMVANTSRLELTATFEGNPAPGVFRDFDARLRMDPDKPASNRLDVDIVVKSADMNSADINQAIGSAEWFDFAHFPTAQFRATDIRSNSNNRYVARGTLNLKGVQQPMEVPFKWTESGDTARMEGEFVVKRGAFGIGTGDWAGTSVIGADVKIKFDVQLHKSG